MAGVDRIYRLTVAVTVVVLMAAFLVAPPADASSQLSFSPSDDATVRESRPTNNYGNSPVLEVDADSRKDALLRFDVTGVGTSAVTGATLRLFNVDSSSSGGDVAVVTDSGWNEGSVTWANAPAGDGGALGSLGDVSAGNWYEIDVTSLVTGDGPVSVRISSTNANGADYSSSEHTNGNAPELIVDVDGPPGSNPGTFDVSRQGSTSTYDAISPSSSYSGSLKSVVESAVNELNQAGGGTVRFAAGDFDLGSDHFELNDITDVVFEGAGMGITTIRNFTDASADTEPFDAERSDRLTIRDLTVSAGGSDRETSDALDFDGGDDILIERVEITDSRGRGILFDGKDAVAVTGGTAERNVVRDCVITNTPRDGIQLLAASNNTIENCQISNVGAEGIRVHKASDTADQPNKPSDDNVIVGNAIDGATGSGVAVTSGNRNTISGNTLTNNGVDGIRVFTPVSSLSCDDNVVDGNTASSNRYGLNIENPECNRTVVGANDFSGNSAADINDSGTDTIYTGDPGTFTVSRQGSTSTYDAISATSSYSGSLKSVVESAVNELNQAGGGTVRFTAGDFDLGSDHFELDGITDVVFEGAGMGVTTIRNFTNASADTEPFDAVRSDRLTIRDLTVAAGGSDRTTSDALDFDGGDDIVIERVEVTDSRGRGIVFDGKDPVSVTGGTADRNVIRDCVVTNTPRDGIQLLASNNNTIENCQIAGAGAEGIRVHKASSSAGQPNKPSNDNLIVGNTIDGSADNGVAVTSGNRNTITGNTLTNNGTDGIRVFTSSSSLSCDDNVVDGNTANGNRYGLIINDPECNRTVVGDNDFSGNSAGPILDNGTDTIYTSGDTEPPSVPANLTATDVQATRVSLAWDASTDNVAVTGYDIFRDGSLLDSVGATTTYQDTTVAPESSYQYEVVARDAAGNTSTPSDPVDVTTPVAPPVQTFGPTDDATIRESRPTANLGSRNSLEVDADSRKDTLLRFDVSGVGSSSVTSATLRLFAIDGSPTGGDVAIATDSGWNEGSVTWATAPAGDGGMLGPIGAVDAGNWYEIDVTGLVTGDGPVSLRISSTNRNGADYASKEHTNGNAAQLEVVSTP